MISKKEVEHLTKLARLQLSSVESKKMQKDLSEVFDYFTLLKKVVGKDVVQPAMKGHLRKDVARQDKTADKLIALSPDKKDRHIKVKAIL